MTTRHDEFDDDLLRHYYERELEILRRDLRAFAQRNPEAATRLSINSDGRSDDAGVERMVQSTAILHARHSVKIDDDYPELSEALIERTFPQYLRSFPSYSVAQFDMAGRFDSMTESVRIERGTQLKTTEGGCLFRTTYDVVLAPVEIARAQYATTPTAPLNVKLPPDASGMISLTLRSAKIGSRLDAVAPATLRVHLAGQPPVVAALLDTMLLRTARAYVEDSEGRWTRLPTIAVAPVGFGPHDWLVTDAKEPGQPFGLLAEYFAYAERFHFVDIDLASVCAAAPGEQLTLHWVVTGVPPNSRAAQQLAHVSADRLKLFCTPVVNLFERKGVSLKHERQSGGWPIHAQAKNDAHTEVWSVDQVRTEQGDPLRSSAALMTSAAHPTWTLIQHSGPLSLEAGLAAALRLDGADGPMRTGLEMDTLVADVTCTNGDLPHSLPFGASGGDMRLAATKSATEKIVLLRAPTAIVRLSRSNGALWRLIGQQTPHALRLTQAALPALKQLFQQFAQLSHAQAQHIDGIMGLKHRSVMTLMARAPQPAMVRGIEVTLEIDEQRFVACSVAVFARAMERFFAPYAPSNSFVQLIIGSSSIKGVVLWRGEPVCGGTALL
ncbi:type VI secretion system baseplate subunit TssF [Trinickia dabaoshanensis]|uniref:Type VI secretion system baseplate subunit TssF n=1 Tax=Trinickia dabaoshanensis TaxID=564714 RepID=A0A2N7VAZ4_9BURK|nr:type VI secretion system baseplate subunit TssF [Trinickia dabaoshanensis]PMS13961.1 type VI secretion system baseplate subunit TssF [Trinickia dabaoshanensis]